ncbi:hypothetical protein LIT38_03660 [Bacillus sp. CMF12]|nr:hypothetical protein [Bacillus sp. CMF12]USK50574.1 hypothetical protein LIT38_03660 [Bacillus sp. CMF12]
MLNKKRLLQKENSTKIGNPNLWGAALKKKGGGNFIKRENLISILLRGV